MKQKCDTGVHSGPFWLPGSAASLVPSLVLSAYVMALSVGGHAYPWLGLVALLPLLRAIQVLRPSRAAFSGGIWGVSFYFLATTAVDTSVGAGVLPLALLAAIPAIYAGLGAVATRRVGFSPFILAYGWILVELALRPIALKRGLLAGTQGDGWFAIVIGHGLGYIAVAFLVAFASAWLLEILNRIRFRLDGLTVGVVLDDVGSWLWHVIQSRHLCLALSPTRPRAPPIRR